MARKNATVAALFALGFLSIGTQIYLVREVMSQLGDNELIIGLVLGIWMVFTGAGAALARPGKIFRVLSGRIPSLLLLTGILPLLMIAGISLLKSLLVPAGSMPGPGQILFLLVVVTIPFGLLNGYIFSRLSATEEIAGPGDAYSWETVGSLASGALINFVLLWTMGSFPSLVVLQTVYFLIILWYIFCSCKRRTFLIFAAISGIYIILTAFSHPAEWIGNINFPNQKVVSDRETPYGRVVITQQANQLSFYENGILLFSSGNEISNEEDVHYAMVQHPDPDHILLISGGFSGTLEDILKYAPERIDYFEMNPALIAIAARYTRQLTHPAVRLHTTDARKFIRQCSNTYDVILVNLPSPSSLQLNRYYSAEFLSEAKRSMKRGGVIAFGLPGSADYIGDREAMAGSVLWNTLKSRFAHVIVVPGNKNYFLASDDTLSWQITSLIDRKGIPTQYVNRYYLDEKQLSRRAGQIIQVITGEHGDGKEPVAVGINTDCTPVSVWLHLSWWLGFHQVSLFWFIMAFAVLILLMVLTLNPVSAGLFTGSFTLISLEVMLIMGIQILTGYLFQAVSAVITVFMLGLAVGAGTGKKTGGKSTFGIYILLQLFLATGALGTPWVITWLAENRVGDWPIRLTLFVLSLGLSYLVGAEYRIAATLSRHKGQMVIATNYSADMFGAAAGALVASMFLIPVAGMVKTGILLAFLNIASAGALLVRRKMMRQATA